MNLFKGLERFGIKSDVVEHVLSEEKKTETAPVKKEEKPKEELPTEKDFLLEKTLTCVVCDKKFKTWLVKNSRLKRTESDEDLRPRFLYIDTLKYDVASCPHCGYTAMNRYFEHISSAQMKLVREAVCKNFKPTGKTELELFDYDFAIDRYKLSLLNTVVKKGRMSEKAYTCLKIAWLYRGKAETLDPKDAEFENKKKECSEQEEEFYKEAFEGFTKAVATEMFPICGMDQITMDYLLAVMAKHFKQYDTASKCLSRILGSSSASKRMKDKAYELKEQLVAEYRTLN